MIKRVALIDFDTPVYSSACIIQVSPILVTHKINKKRKKEFKNITEWRTFLKLNPGYSEDDFDLASEPRLKQGEEISHALHIIKNKIEGFRKLEWVSDVQLFVGGTGNYRKEHYPEYKGTRPPKPLFFQQCYEYVLNNYKDIVTVCDGEEAEDQVSIRSHASYLRARALKSQDAMDSVVCGIDKDLNQCEGWRFNYDKPELGVWWVDDRTAWKALCLQCFKGDNTDDIPGIVSLTPEVKEQYGIKTKGVGDKTAELLMEGTTTVKEMTQRVVDVYRASWPDCWETKLNTNAILLRLRKYDGELFNFVDHAKNMGVV